MALIPNSRPQRTLGNGRQALAVINDSGFPLEVTIVDPGVITNVFSSVTSVSISTLTDVLTYTVPIGMTFKVNQIEVSGSNKAEYTIDIDGGTEGFKRTSLTEFSTTFDYFQLTLTAGQVLKVKAEHCSTMVGDFEARLIGSLI